MNRWRCCYGLSEGDQRREGKIRQFLQMEKRDDGGINSMLASKETTNSREVLCFSFRCWERYTERQGNLSKQRKANQMACEGNSISVNQHYEQINDKDKGF